MELFRLVLCSFPFIVIALSSGQDHYIGEHYIASTLSFRLATYKLVRFVPFMYNEAKAFVVIMDNSTIEKVRKLLN